jgi:hypothetical protein
MIDKLISELKMFLSLEPDFNKQLKKEREKYYKNAINEINKKPFSIRLPAIKIKIREDNEYENILRNEELRLKENEMYLQSR